MTSRIPSRSLARLSFIATVTRSLSTATESQTQKLERIADELLSLTKLEKYDYSVLFGYKMGFNMYGPAVTGLGSVGHDSAAAKSRDAKSSDKVVFDVKLEKFDAAAKIKIIKEVRAFTELGLKVAKDLVEKAPIVVKKGITEEEGESIMANLLQLGATVYGRTPVQLAAMNENLEVIKVLNQEVGKEDGESILQVCVEYNRFEALKLFIELWGDEGVAKVVDGDGNTLLHLAALHNHTQRGVCSRCIISVTGMLLL